MTDAYRFSFGDEVEFRARGEEDSEVTGIVTGIILREHGVQYLVAWGDSRDESSHYDVELRNVTEGATTNPR